MRTPRHLIRSAVAGAAAAILLTACGGSGEDEPAATSATTSTPTSSAAPSEPTSTASPDPAAAAFCEQVRTAFDELSATLSTAGPQEVAGRLPEVVAVLEQIEAPADISADWQTLVDARGCPEPCGTWVTIHGEF